MKDTEKNMLLASSKYRAQKEFWIKLLDGELDATRLLEDYTGPKVGSGPRAEVELAISEDLAQGLLKLCKGSDLSLYIICVAALKVLLYKYTGDQDLLVGSPVYQTHADELTFNQAVVLRTSIQPELSFKETLIQVRQGVLDAYNHQDYPLDQIVEYIDLPSGAAFSQVYEVACLLNTLHDSEILNQWESKMVVQLNRDGDGLTGKIYYDGSRYQTQTMEQFATHWSNLMQVVLQDLQMPIGQLSILSEDEQEHLTYGLNQTEMAYEKGQTLAQIFEEQVDKYPDHVALVFEEREMTYRELNQKANQLARTLRVHGVQADHIVGIMVDRSFEMIIGMIAVLKAGGAYLPIDTDYPEERIQYMLEDSATEILLTQKQYIERVGFTGKTILIDEDGTYTGETTNLENLSQLKDLAYLIYTSGTTGKPKGVMIEQGNVLAYTNAFYNQFPITAEDAIVQQASYSFDHFVEEVYPVLLRGGKVVIVKRNELLDIQQFARIIERNQVNIVSVSPLILNELNKLPSIKSVRLFLSGGDVLKAEYISNLLKQGEVFNTYGPTEATVCASYYQCDENPKSGTPIGTPIANYQILILDEQQQLVPIGVKGEIYISGDGVGRGYLNRPELTAEAFMPNPYMPGKRMYKTGDYGRWLWDGNIEFLGRTDHQIKIRGYRIELEEIESRLLKHEAIGEVVVLAREDQHGEKYLCAYLVLESPIGEEELRAYLEERLPQYMVPAFFVFLDEMPMTLNGFKINRKALPDPCKDLNMGAEYLAPGNVIEKKLVKIWAKILDLPEEQISVERNFFDLGGHSLKATQLVAHIYKDFSVELPLSIIFQAPTVRDLAKTIMQADKSIYSSIQPQPEADSYPVSSAQERVYTVNKYLNAGISYNIPMAVQIEGDLDQQRVEDTLNQLMARHESLRTSFEETEDGDLVQVIAKELHLTLKSCQARDGDLDQIIAEFITPFDLGRAPLFRATLVQVEEKRHLLLFDIHHIIADGVSANILIRDFCDLYAGQELAPLRIQYKDVTVWQKEFMQTESFFKQERYWLEQFQTEVPILELPLDGQREAGQNFEGDKVELALSYELTKQVYSFAQREDVTVNMFLMACYQLLLARYSGQEDLVVGLPIAGRNHYDLESIVGMFVNTLAIRTQPVFSKTFGQFLKEVKETCLRAYENQDYQFEMLIDRLNFSRELGRNPLLDTMFVLQNLDDEEIQLGDLRVTPYPFEFKRTKLDLVLEGVEREEDLLFTLNYATRLFNQETMDKFLQQYVKVIQEVVQNKEILIGDVELLDEAEKSALLEGMLESENQDLEIDFSF